MTIFGLPKIALWARHFLTYEINPRVARLILKKFIAFVPTQANCGRSISVGVPRSVAVTILPMVRPRNPPVPKARVL